ncbi:MAG: ADP-glyceromanno-heptose 6-epimerase [Bacteroidetes bacterium GWE2_29_8]|nr:MAG: ADP-glyceromanno-heptose 6-epimerase [Bacteroidetes bacterium GWE2_29_8]OFY23202.1 MAG: ADP-glyceromanno-heptose 6-epimerase [Bacteroidetes bacterium GWF2_29_10]
MIVLTGSAGFIGSCVLSKLNQEGIYDILLVDKFNNPLKNENFKDKKYFDKIDRNLFIPSFDKQFKDISLVIHLGARTDTTEFDKNIFDELNLNYSKQLWNKCAKYNIPFIYASSAATYGNGELGYKDDDNIISKLKPLNPYGESKNEFDKWVLQQTTKPPYWYGLKFFNVYGPNEYHKARMASVIFHAYNQIKNGNNLKLFRSHKPEFKDGQQLRDFIYVKDICSVIYFLLNHKQNSGIYNLGTGKAQSFNDLALAVYDSMQISPSIEFIDIPLDIREKYQYFTQADMAKLINIGYNNQFYNLNSGIKDYIQNYLTEHKYL